MPAPQREALLAAFGHEAATADPQPDPLLIRYAALSLLSDAATDRRLLLLVDDVQWLDQGSVDVLAFIARRLDGEAIAVLLAAREEGLPGQFDREFAVLAVTPLDRVAAGLLLDRQPRPPRGRARLRIFEQAGGNPLALIELARAVALEPGERRGRTPPNPFRSPPAWNASSRRISPVSRSGLVRCCCWRPRPAPRSSPRCCGPP